MWPCSDIPSVSNILILEGSYNKLLDGQKVISMFYKLDIEEPERVLNKLSRGQGGNINKKYFTTWVFSEHKVRATETVLPTTSIPSNRNSNNTNVASKTDTNVASKTDTNVASKSNPTIDIKTNTDTNTSSQKQQQASKLRTLELTKNTEALKTYGMAALNKVGQSFGESKIRALCQKLSTDPSNNDSLLKRDLVIQFIGQLNLKQPELVVNALCNGTSEGDISKQLLLSWCGFESTSITTDPSPAFNSEPARTQGKVTKQLSQSEKQLLQYGQQSLEKIGRSFGKAKLNALCKQMEMKTDADNLDRTKLISFFTQLKLKHGIPVLAALSGSTDSKIPKSDFMEWCGIKQEASDSAVPRQKPGLKRQLSQSEHQLMAYGKSSLEKVSASLGKTKMMALIKQMICDRKGNYLDRDKVVQLFEKLKFKHAPHVLNALSETTAGAISKMKFMEWCGILDWIKDRYVVGTNEAAPTFILESDKYTMAAVAPKRQHSQGPKRQLSQSDQHLLAYGKSALQKLGASFGHAKVMALCRKMECNETHLNRNKVIHFLEQVSLKHSTYVLSALSGKTEGAIPKVDFMNWCGMENGRQDIDPYTPLSMMDFTDV